VKKERRLDSWFLDRRGIPNVVTPYHHGREKGTRTIASDDGSSRLTTGPPSPSNQLFSVVVDQKQKAMICDFQWPAAGCCLIIMLDILISFGTKRPFGMAASTN
jgi:hypothetical protein